MTGHELAAAAVPSAGSFVLAADKVVSVAAPDGNGNDAADTGRVETADAPSLSRTKTGAATGASTVSDPALSVTGNAVSLLGTTESDAVPVFAPSDDGSFADAADIVASNARADVFRFVPALAVIVVSGVSAAN